jgi:hypothetical protein
MVRTLINPQSFRLTEMLLLVLMLWPAPLPSGHCHSDPKVERTGHKLAEHLQRHHGGWENAANWPQDWHWHWTFSADRSIGLGVDQTDRLANCNLADRHCQATDLVCLYRFGGLNLQCEHRLTKVPSDRQYSFQAVALLASRQSLPELLGIMRL